MADRTQEPHVRAEWPRGISGANGAASVLRELNLIYFLLIYVGLVVPSPHAR
jgi:hypothetical protein